MTIITTDISLSDAIYQRRSIRGFTDQVIPDEILAKIFQLAQQSPSNCNIQPWKVVVVSGERKDQIKEKLTHLVKTAPRHSDYPELPKLEDKYRARQVECASELYTHMGVARNDKDGRTRVALKNYDFFDAPHALFTFVPKSFGGYALLDVGMYLQTLMLSMTAFGIGSCAQGSLTYYPDAVREEFGIDPSYGLICGMSFGYENTDEAANKVQLGRADVAENVTFLS